MGTQSGPKYTSRALFLTLGWSSLISCAFASLQTTYKWAALLPPASCLNSPLSFTSEHVGDASQENLLRCKRGSRHKGGRSPKVWMSGEQIWYLPAAVHVGVWIFKCTLFGWVSFSDVSLLHIGLCRVEAKIHGHSQDNIFTMSDCQHMNRVFKTF